MIHRSHPDDVNTAALSDLLGVIPFTSEETGALTPEAEAE
jgi:hypothetical protein